VGEGEEEEETGGST
jgi:hypothetical protein